MSEDLENMNEILTNSECFLCDASASNPIKFFLLIQLLDPVFGTIELVKLDSKVLPMN